MFAFVLACVAPAFRSGLRLFAVVGASLQLILSLEGRAQVEGAPFASRMPLRDPIRAFEFVLRAGRDAFLAGAFVFCPSSGQAFSRAARTKKCHPDRSGPPFLAHGLCARPASCRDRGNIAAQPGTMRPSPRIRGINSSLQFQSSPHEIRL
jgi:hypothetical protein